MLINPSDSSERLETLRREDLYPVEILSKVKNGGSGYCGDHAIISAAGRSWVQLDASGHPFDIDRGEEEQDELSKKRALLTKVFSRSDPLASSLPGDHERMITFDSLRMAQARAERIGEIDDGTLTTISRAIEKVKQERRHNAQHVMTDIGYAIDEDPSGLLICTRDENKNPDKAAILKDVRLGFFSGDDAPSVRPVVGGQYSRVGVLPKGLLTSLFIEQNPLTVVGRYEKSSRAKSYLVS